jgi:hypothetical protein
MIRSMDQNAYLFSAGVSIMRMVPVPGARGGQTLNSWDTCMTAIVHGSDAAGAQKSFENWCLASREDEQTTIKKLLFVPLMAEVLTETGGKKLNWPELILRQTSLPDSSPVVESEQEAVPLDFGQGYWVDANQAVPPKSSHLDLESLRRELPTEISSDLNWSPDKKFIFLVTALNPRPIPQQYAEDDMGDGENPAEGELGPELEQSVSDLPEMREKAAAALVEARNSVAAAWLWRRFAALTPLALNEILVSPCCQILAAEPAPDPSGGSPESLPNP